MSNYGVLAENSCNRVKESEEMKSFGDDFSPHISLCVIFHPCLHLPHAFPMIAILLLFIGHFQSRLEPLLYVACFEFQLRVYHDRSIALPKPYHDQEDQESGTCLLGLWH